MEKYEVSIIIPVYNVEKYLKRCLETIINQTLKNIEIILVDDGSTDNCSKICDEYSKKDQRIKVIHKENGGLGYARNSGIEIAKGKYIAFIDSDDFVDLNFYERLYMAAEKNNSDMCISQYAKFYSDKKIIRNNFPFEEIDVSFEPKDVLYNMLKIPNKHKYYIGMSVWKAIYKRSILEENNICFLSEREILSEDIFFNFIFLENIKSKVILCKGVNYYYCFNGSSLTNKYREDRFEKAKILREKLIEVSKKYSEYDYLKKYIESFFMSYVRQAVKQEAMSTKDNSSKKKAISYILKDNTTIQALKNKSYENLGKTIFDFFLRLSLVDGILVIYRIKKKIQNMQLN